MKTNSTKKITNWIAGTKFLAVIALSVLNLDADAQVTTFNYTGSMQTYTVPVGVNLIRIDAQGAQGGSITIACAATGGLGARMVGDVSVTPGEVISVLVGGQGLTQGEDGGGGGGSFTVRTGNVPLVIAGGGGGATNNIQICTGLRNGVDASITTSGTASANGLVAGGTGGNGGGAQVGSGCGGGGFYTDGAYAANMNGRGRAYVNGGAGGTGQNNNHGGYGGGGCGWYNGGNGGGGGGYSGGGTDGNYPSTYFGGGGGGGSYNIGTNQTNTAGFRTGNGQVIITVLSSFSVNVTQTAFIQCNGQSTASLSSTPVGGTGPYTYSWAPTGGNTATATGLGAGTYTVTITDSGSNTSTQTFTVTQPAVLAATATATNITCFGSADGAAAANPTGGTSPYTYAWSNGGTTATISGLVSGVYSCTVTCSNGCTTTTSTTITQPAVLTATSSSTNLACFGDNNGTATQTASGGTAPYTYLWSNGGNTATISGLSAGTYVGTVTCTNGCTATVTATITEPAAIVPSVTFVNVLCFGDASGSIDLNVTGGTGPFTYDWNSGTYTTQDLSGLTAGTYIGVLTDANGCSQSGTVVLTQPSSAVTSTVTTMTNPTTCGGTDGGIDITVNGGTPGYTYMWSPAATTEDLVGVSAGTYSCTILDQNGCSTTIANTTLTGPTPPTVALSIVSDTVCLADGAFTIGGESPSGGTFSGPGVTAGTFDPFTAGVGTHGITYTYTDANSCTGTAVDSIYVDICLGTQLPALSSTFTVYPNPNNGTFTLQLNTVSAADVLVYDAQGKLISTQKVQSSNEQITIGESGMYMITVITGDGVQSSQRVIVTE